MKEKKGNFRTRFSARVLKIVSGIPTGKTMTYKQVAALAGNSRASRAVGSILRFNFDKSIPCHRVIKSDGTLGGYNRGAANKIKLLKKERAI